MKLKYMIINSLQRYKNVADSNLIKELITLHGVKAEVFTRCL